MKIPLLSLFVAILWIGESPAQTSTASVYSQAQRAYLSGDTATAKEKFLEVLSAEPTNLGAKNYLKSIEVDEKKNKKSALSEQLGQLIIPRVQFKEASLSSVLAFLKTKAAEVSKDKVSPSFVLDLPPKYSDETTLTLELTNVPFTEVLHYIGGLTATKFEIQPYAIVVKKM